MNQPNPDNLPAQIIDAGAPTLHEKFRADPYYGAFDLAITPEQGAKLAAKFAPEQMNILPTGEVYVSHTHLRQRLTEAFGFGQWIMLPRGNFSQDGNLMLRQYALVIKGCFVAEAVGEMEWQPTNKRMTKGDAMEGVTSNALMRLCKAFGVGLQSWDKVYNDKFIAEHCVRVWRRDLDQKNKYQWRRKDATPWYDESAAPPSGGAQGEPQRPQRASNQGSSPSEAGASRDAGERPRTASPAAETTSPGNGWQSVTVIAAGVKGERHWLKFQWPDMSEEYAATYDVELGKTVVALQRAKGCVVHMQLTDGSHGLIIKGVRL